MIEVDKLSVEYPTGILAVEDVTLTVDVGEIVVLSGPNGGGKTTILRAVSGIIPHYIKARVRGQIRIDDVDPIANPNRVRRLLQITQQDPTAQVVGPTVYAEAALTPSLWGLEPREVIERAERAVSSMGLTRLRNRPVHRLSSGELTRTALAGVLSVTPKYILLDEPTSHLDEEGVRMLLEIIAGLKDEGLGIIIATHDPRIYEIADKCYTVQKYIREGCAERPPLPRNGKKSLNDAGDIVVSLEDVWVRYPGDPNPILKGVNLQLREGELVSIVGPNGSGKTTLLYTIAGVLKPFKGRILVRKKPALLPPDPLLVFSRGTLRDEFLILKTGIIPRWISNLVDKPLLSMSGGELKLSSLALVAVSNRRLLLLDEPTEGLDPWNRKLIAEAIIDLSNKGLTILYTTHDKELASLADRMLKLKRGVVE